VQYDYGFRIYDPRLGRFLSLDPLARDYPYYSPYHFAGNSPIKFIDLDGGEPKDYVDNWTPKPMGYFGTNRFVEAADENHSSLMLEEPGLGYIRVQQIYDATTDKHWFVHHNKGTGKYYYYKADDGQHNILTVQIPKNGLGIITKGSMVEFETEDAAQARIGKEVAEGLATFWSVTLGGTIATNGGAIYYAVMAALEDALGIPLINSPDDLAKLNAKNADDLPGTGQYDNVGGHHVHAKAGFKGHLTYDKDKGFAISQDFMKENGLDHAAMTKKQRNLFDELNKNGGSNTLVEHSRIAKEALIAGGASAEMADDLVNRSLKNLADQNVTAPTHIPWKR